MVATGIIGIKKVFDADFLSAVTGGGNCPVSIVFERDDENILKQRGAGVLEQHPEAEGDPRKCVPMRIKQVVAAASAYAVSESMLSGISQSPGPCTGCPVSAHTFNRLFPQDKHGFRDGIGGKRSRHNGILMGVHFIESPLPGCCSKTQRRVDPPQDILVVIIRVVVPFQDVEQR